MDFFFKEQIHRPKPGSLVLDLGGHKEHKRGAFDIEQYDLNVLYANLSNEKGTDVIADGALVPMQSATFDAVICGELLEHVIDSELVLGEVFRLLGEGGVLILTVPFFHPIHADPYDFGRYTAFYWQSVLGELGFSEIFVEPQGAFYAVMFSFVKLYLNHLRVPRPFGRIVRWLLSRIFVAPLRRIMFYADCKGSAQSNGHLQSYTTGYGIVAMKASVVCKSEGDMCTDGKTR